MNLLFSLLTIGLFFLAIHLSRRLKSALFNPFIIALLMIVGVLVWFDVPYQTYYQGNVPLNSMLNLSIVALALPFYEQFPQVKRQWKQILLICSLSALLTLLSGMLLAVWFGGGQESVASIAGKSVTMPMALLISDALNGNPALTGIGVMIAGLTGSVFGLVLLKLFGIKQHAAIGLSMGAVSHALGTVRSMEVGPQAASYASIAFVLCGVISSFLAPLAFRWTLGLLN